MDELDRRILNRLQSDGRCSYADLGRLVGLSVTAVKERLDKLQRNDVLRRYSIIVDEKKVGYGVLAFVFIGIDDPEDCAAFERQMLEIPQVQECHHVTGGFNYLLKVIANDMSRLEDLLLQRIKLPGVVSRSETTIVFSSPKNSPFVDCVANGA
ncbi:Lrp/AsnC family transcriptional regulator [Sneathiella glossodoripedis]|uniref:Lrp/AsnC family transcriptional regulator n=1 Tax=Sneathiella glossodoripedis TaxID=418853 RepID=UPI00046F8A07|nr:Lrp/AsnC family transcriptional regulator [Sneathiella glossodoripedis]